MSYFLKLNCIGLLYFVSFFSKLTSHCPRSTIILSFYMYKNLCLSDTLPHKVNNLNLTLSTTNTIIICTFVVESYWTIFKYKTWVLFDANPYLVKSVINATYDYIHIFSLAYDNALDRFSNPSNISFFKGLGGDVLEIVYNGCTWSSLDQD